MIAPPRAIGSPPGHPVYPGRLCRALVGVALAAGAARAGAQSLADTVRGRVVAGDGTPIASARVSVTGDDGRVHLARTDGEGRYRVVVPNGGGRYQVNAAAFGYTPFTVVALRPAGAAAIARDLRLSPRRIALDTVRATAQVLRVRDPRGSPGEESGDWSSLAGERYPVDPGDLAAMAALEPGVLAFGNGDISVAGQSPSQNRTTVDGASQGAGALPSEGVRSAGMVTSTFDPARGQFSGGQIAARTLSGTNRWGGALTARLHEPALEFGRMPGAGLGAGERTVRFDGGGGGALVRDRFFVYGALGVRRTSGPPSFLDLDDAAGLRRMGIAADSARRFAEIAGRVGVPRSAGPPGDLRRSSSSAFARLDYTLSANHALTARFDWREAHSDVGGSSFQLPGTSGETRSRDGGVMLQLASGWASWANEVRVYASEGKTEAEALPGLPSANVRVLSVFEDGSLGDSQLGFGGPGVPVPEGGRRLRELADDLVWESGDGSHRVKAGVLLQEERIATSTTSGFLGTFTFNSLADLEAGTPASFTRLLGDLPAEVAAVYGGVYLGDTWRATDAIRVTGGLRLEGTRFGDRPPLAAAARALPGASPGRPGTEVVLLPRVGFSYSIPGRGSVGIRGGIGRFRGTVPLRHLAGAWGETGTPLARRLVCIGPAAPTPDWSAYADDPATVPTDCSAPASGFGDGTAPAAIFADDFGAPRSWRAVLGVGGRLGRLSFYQVDGQVARTSGLPVARDRNRVSEPVFSLADEGGRPVFSAPGAIDPLTGGIAPGGWRLDPTLGSVREISGQGSSWAEQLIVQLHGFIGARTHAGIAYAFSHVRDEAAGVPAPGAAAASSAGDASRRESASSDWEQRHTVQLLVSRWLSPAARVSAIGRLASGRPFTPRVAGDVNGDGFENDRAFVFDPATAPDPALARGMAERLAAAPGAVRACLRRQLDEVARRNSCRTPWNPTLDLQAEVRPWSRQRHRRLAITVVASNVTAGLDYLLHGPDRLRGWGQLPVVDATLLSVRGYDPGRRAFRYDVNPRFGEALEGGGFRVPFALTLGARVTVGADPRLQPLEGLVPAGARSSAAIRAQLAGRVRNVPAVVLALDAAEPGTLGLTPGQSQELRDGADSFAASVAGALDRLAELLARRGPDTAGWRARVAEETGALQALEDEGRERVRGVLAPEQWGRIPAWLLEPVRPEELQRASFTGSAQLGS